MIKSRSSVTMFLILLIYAFSSHMSATKTVLSAGFDIAYPPYEFINTEGAPDGFNIDLLREIARRNDWQLQIHQESWSSALDKFDSGEIDLIAGLIRTNARMEKYVFSNPHTYVHYSIFHRRGKTNVTSWDDLNDYEILIETGDVIDEIVSLNAPGASKTYVPDYIQALNQLAEGHADVAILPRLLGHQHILENDLVSIELSTTLDFAYPYCLAAKPHNTALIDVINTTLAEMENDGSLILLRKKWFSKDTALTRTNKYFVRSNLYLFLLVAATLFIGIVFMLQYYRKRLRKQTELLSKQIAEKNRINQELRVIHRLYQEGPIVVLKWYDSEKEQFSFITDNISQFGYEASDLLNKKINFRDIIHPEDLSTIQEESYKHLNSNLKHSRLCYRIICPSHEFTADDSPSYQLLKQRNPILEKAHSCKLRWVLDYTVQVLDNDRDLRYYYGYLIDISSLYQRYTELSYNRKLAEMAERSKDVFLSSITDEISSPIKDMFASITKLSHSGINEEQQDSLIKLYVSAHRLNSVILQLQNYLYYSSSAVEMHSSWINVDALIRKQIPLMRAKADAKDIKLEYSGRDNEPSIFYSSKYLDDILGILYDNALKFSDSGTITLSYEFEALPGNDGLARICITDEGIGLPEEKMEYILEPFTQVDASYTRERGGIGLGLATLSHIMKISDGSIAIKNRPLRGLEVCVEWMVAYRTNS